MRIDQFLVQLGLVSSRTKSQDLIRAGSVEIFDGRNWKVILSPSFDVNSSVTSEQIRIAESEVLKFVSRGGLKLQAALRHLPLNVQDWTCLDCGQSTGGFSDCLLQSGAKQVVGFDVGHDQLALSMRSHPRLRFFEGLHIKDLASHVEFQSLRPQSGFDLIVADLSFVSLEKVFEYFNLLGSRLLILVKPQFEVGAENLNKKGIVKDRELFSSLEAKLRELAKTQQWKVLDYFPCEVEGRDGNQEFFLYAAKEDA